MKRWILLAGTRDLGLELKAGQTAYINIGLIKNTK